MPAAFDTIAALHRLENAGLSRDAAEAIIAVSLEAVEVARDASLADRGTLATKADLSATKTDFSELGAHFAAVKAELSDRIQVAGRRIRVAVFAAYGLLFAALKLFP